MSDAVHFEDAAVALTKYFVGSLSLHETLEQVSRLAMSALPPTKHAGVTLMTDGRLSTAVFTDDEIVEIDRTQYETGDGPCVEAFRTGELWAITSTLLPGRWPTFRDTAARRGVLSTLSLPLIGQDGAIGALNLYASMEDAYGDEEQRLATVFASQASFVLANAQAYWDARSLSDTLSQALESRAAIEQAKGIIMATTRCTAAEAFDLLVRQSQQQNTKLRDIAASMVKTTSRRL
jgi:GAF domain-containing protein